MRSDLASGGAGKRFLDRLANAGVKRVIGIRSTRHAQKDAETRRLTVLCRHLCLHMPNAADRESSSSATGRGPSERPLARAPRNRGPALSQPSRCPRSHGLARPSFTFCLWRLSLFATCSFVPQCRNYHEIVGEYGGADP
jgi:hypothetical protein